jgi:hypothetical protein
VSTCPATSKTFQQIIYGRGFEPSAARIFQWDHLGGQQSRFGPKLFAHSRGHKTNGGKMSEIMKTHVAVTQFVSNGCKSVGYGVRGPATALERLPALVWHYCTMYRTPESSTDIPVKIVDRWLIRACESLSTMWCEETGKRGRWSNFAHRFITCDLKKLRPPSFP